MRLQARHVVVAALLLLSLDLPAAAQGLNLGLNLGGINVGVNVGGNNGTGVSAGVGNTNVSVGTSNNSNGLFGLDVQADLFGDGSSSSSGTTVLSQSDALAAVASNRALPLDQVMVIAQLSTTGQIIDANLIDLNGFLLYVFKVLETSGDVSELYFYARSGQMVQTR